MEERCFKLNMISLFTVSVIVLFTTFLLFHMSLCYLIGEKYELAKKMKKIKLVNHLWLEDW